MAEEILRPHGTDQVSFGCKELVPIYQWIKHIVQEFSKQGKITLDKNQWTGLAARKKRQKELIPSKEKIIPLKKYLDEFKNKQAEKKEERVDSKSNAPLAADLELGATLNNGSDHDEYKLISSRLSERFFGQDVYTGLVFYDNIKEIFWQGSIEETYQWFEVGNIKLELFDPSGEKRQTCENSYTVSSVDESYMDCTIPMHEIKGVIQPGLWKLKIFRSKALVDERLVLIKALNSSKVFLKKRSDIVSRHSIANL